MGFMKPTIPAMPPIPPVEPMEEPPKYDDEQREEEARVKRARIKAGRTGRSATILTTPKGLEDDEYSTKKTLLGGE